jgi:hypothetical protein
MVMMIGAAAGGVIIVAICIIVVYLIARRPRDEKSGDVDLQLNEEPSVTDPSDFAISVDAGYITQEAGLEDELVPATGAFLETTVPTSQTFGQNADE